MAFQSLKETYSLSNAVRKLRGNLEVIVIAIKMFTIILTRKIQNNILHNTNTT